MNKTNTTKYRILVVSSMPPHHSAGYGWDVVRALESAGHSVDFLTTYSFRGQRKHDIILMKRSGKGKVINFVGQMLRNKHLRFLKNILLNLYNNTIAPTYEKPNGIFIVHPDESKPSIPNKLLVEKIDKDYDAVVTLFWQGMINSSSLVALHNHLKCPIIVDSPDMAPMTGGCQYFNQCRRFEHECGLCPGLNSNDEKDQSHTNYLLKKENYASIPMAFRCNSWMMGFALKSRLFSNNIMSKISFILNENDFIPAIDQKKPRKELKLNANGKKVILLRSAQDYRKGSDYAVMALRQFVQAHPNSCDSLLILTIGEEYVKDKLADTGIKCIHLGLVGREVLIKCYKSADYFINCSVDDAGPSMINQSILCGTPVICFDNGTACDVILDGESGFKCETGDSDNLLKKLETALSLPASDYDTLRKNTREIGLKFNSYDSYINQFEALMQQFESKREQEKIND